MRDLSAKTVITGGKTEIFSMPIAGGLLSLHDDFDCHITEPALLADRNVHLDGFGIDGQPLQWDVLLIHDLDMRSDLSMLSRTSSRLISTRARAACLTMNSGPEMVTSVGRWSLHQPDSPRRAVRSARDKRKRLAGEGFQINGNSCRIRENDLHKV